jgi:hypothetical protein
MPKQSLPDFPSKASIDLARELIAAARKLLAEGEAIVQRARDVYGITAEPRNPGRAWPGPPPPEPVPDYYLSERDKADVVAVVTMLGLARVTKRPGTLNAALRDVGVHLQRLRDGEGRDKVAWLEIVKCECGLGKNRAYEIMAFSRKTFAEKSNASPENSSKTGGKEG